MKLSLGFFLILTVILATTGCGKKEPEPVPSEPPLEKSPLSLSPLSAPVSDSPLPLPTGEPTQPNGEKFHLDKPLRAGTKEVTGRGPADIPLQVIDITAGGEILGSGIIDDDGSFAIGLGVPVEANRVIGIRLSVPKDPDTWLGLWALRGENARAIPNVGDFFDTAVSSSD
jgi:hypothetical protein